MAIKIRFDAGRNPIPPTLVLAKKNGERLGAMDTESIVVKGAFTEPEEINFNTHKYYGKTRNYLWDEIVDLRLCWAKEWNKWFELKVDIDEDYNPMKTVYCTNLGVAELAQIMVFGVEINTETDIQREEYKRATIVYDPQYKESSLLHRILADKAPHYQIRHVDYTLQNLQRTFTFDNVSIYDAFNQIAEELHCVFDYTVETLPDGTIARYIDVYDLNSYCNSCKNRDEFHDFCPKCGSTDIVEGYGKDTGIFITEDMLGQDIKLTTDDDAVKNCFKITAGDDLVSATVANANPNGTPYIWYFSDAMKKDMSPQLVDKLEEYDDLYQYYYDRHSVSLDADVVSSYNALIQKYQAYNKDLAKINNPLVGYPALINAYYDCIDMGYYLRDVLYPEASYEMTKTDAQTEANTLHSGNLRNVAVANIKSASKTTAENAVLNLAKSIVSTNFQVKVNSSAYDTNSHVWTGNFKVTNYYDDEDVAYSPTTSVNITGDYSTYVNQRIDRLLHQQKDDLVNITELFKSTNDRFANELKKYCLKGLETLHDACQECLDIMIELDIPNTSTWNDANVHKTIYNEIYVPYYNKLKLIESEMTLRQSEIDIVNGDYDKNGGVVKTGLRTLVVNEINRIQKELDFEKYIGDLWTEFCTFRREQEYNNSNFISDALTNKELFDQVNQLMDTAKKDLYKSAELQHTITATLKNILVMEKFQPLVENFEAGNWLRVRVDDKIYHLRMLDYELVFDELDTMQIQFSDVTVSGGAVSDIKSVLEKSQQMATSYESVKRQADKGKKANSIVQNWFENGLDATNIRIVGNADNQAQSWDEHGMLFKQYDHYNEEFEPEQMKIINNSIALTDDNWEHLKTAIGKFYYRDPVTGELVQAWGVNGETLVGKLILGESLGIYNTENTMTFDKDGLTIKNDYNTVSINPNDKSIFTITDKNDKEVINMNEDGSANFTGHVNATSLSAGGKTSIDSNSNGLYISEDGSIYAGYGNSVTIQSNGYFNMANGGIVYDADGFKINFNGTSIDQIAQNASNAVTSVKTLYGFSNSESSVPTSWAESKDITDWDQGDYIWSKTVTTYVNGRTEESTPFCMKGTKGEDGESALTVQISSSNGNIFKQRDIQTTLTCRVYYGTKDVTSMVKTFTWKKYDKNGDLDTSWNRLVNSNIIVLTDQDVLEKANFECEIEIDL